MAFGHSLLDWIDALFDAIDQKDWDKAEWIGQIIRQQAHRQGFGG